MEARSKMGHIERQDIDYTVELVTDSGFSELIDDVVLAEVINASQA